MIPKDFSKIIRCNFPEYAAIARKLTLQQMEAAVLNADLDVPGLIPNGASGDFTLSGVWKSINFLKE